MLSHRTQYHRTKDLLEMINTYQAEADKAVCQEERPRSAGTMWVDFDSSGEPIVRYRDSQEDYTEEEYDSAHDLKSDVGQAMPIRFYDQGHIQPLKIPPGLRMRDEPRVCVGSQRTLQQPHHVRNPLGTQAHTEHLIPRHRAAEPSTPHPPLETEPAKKEKPMSRFSRFVSRSREKLREASILSCFTIEPREGTPVAPLIPAQHPHEHYHTTRPGRSQEPEQTTSCPRTRQGVYAGDKSPHRRPQQHSERDQGRVPQREAEACSRVYRAVPAMQRESRHDQYHVSYPAPRCQNTPPFQHFER